MLYVYPLVQLQATYNQPNSRKNIHAERNDRYDADITDTRIFYIPSEPLAYNNMGKTEKKCIFHFTWRGD